MMNEAKNDMGISKICDLAINAVCHIEKGETFTIEDLYPKMIWKNMESIRKAEVARKFWDFTQTEKGKECVRVLDKADAEKQKYEKL